MTRTGGEERRAQLIALAVKLFGARGLEGTSLDDIAEAAGVRKQTILYYFPSKDALFDACVETLGSRVAAELERALNDEFERDWDRVARVVHTMFRLADRWPEFPAFIREASRRGPDAIEKIATQLDPLRRRALEYLERGMSDGTFRKQDPTLLLFTLYTAVVGSLTEAGVLRAVAGGAVGADALKRREKELMDFVLGALKP